MLMERAHSQAQSIFPQLGFGLGLRSDHCQDVLSGCPTVSWFEVISENYLRDGGRPLFRLESVRKNFPIALHGVSLSLGSADPLDQTYLKKLKALIHRIEPALVSDHCCWTGVDKENLYDLLPLPYTEEAIVQVVDKIKQTQDFLGRRILIENLSSYITFKTSEMTEWEFLSEIVNRADCGLLLDVNNIYVSSVNHGFDPKQFILNIPSRRVGQIHLAGHTEKYSTSGKKFILDSHDAPVCPEVWDLYRFALEQMGPINTMVEWDANIPKYEVLEAEINKARLIEDELYGRHKVDTNPTHPPKNFSADHQVFTV